MATVNSYATLAEYKTFTTARTQTATTDAADDVVIDSLLDAASRYIDEQTMRKFYPTVETLYYDVPNSRLLTFRDDLCAVISLTNGDGSAIPSTEYHLYPKNITPHYGLKLKDITAYSWLSTAAGSLEYAIVINGIYAYHEQYDLFGWTTGTTLTEALDVSETEWDVTSESPFSIGKIIKVDNEFGIISSTATGKITVVARGANGSTAATHDDASTIYIWKPMDVIKNACLQIAQNSYKRRSGQGTTSATITAAGVVLTPQDIPANATAILVGLRKIT